MSSGRKASLRFRRRSSGKIRLRVTTPQATKLKMMLTKKQICVRMTDAPMGRFYRRRNNPRLAVSDARIALPDFYDVAVGIANVAARLAVFGLWLGDELGAPALPKFIARLNIGNADIHKAADRIGIGRDAECYRRFVGGRAAADVDNE